MKLASTIFVFAFIVLGQMLVGCNAGEQASGNSGNEDTKPAVNAGVSRENANTVKDNVEELELTVKLPAHPEEVSWREDKTGASANNASQTAKRLTAVLKFTAEDAAKIVAQAQTYQPPAPTQIETESWFPAELIAQSELSGDETLKGSAYAPNDFLQPPFSSGKLTRLEASNYFILELSAE